MCCAYTSFRWIAIARYDLWFWVLTLQGRRLKYSVNILLTCILNYDAQPGYLIRTVCNHTVLLLIMNIIYIFIQFLFRDRCSLTSRKLYRMCFLQPFLCFFYINLIKHIQRKNNNYYDVKLGCSTSTVEIWLTFHISSGQDGNNITTMVNCLETDLLNH